MRWYSLLSLLSDGRIRFLLLFVVAALLVATILTIIEINLKKKKERHIENKVKESVLENLRRFLKYDKTPREKLDFVDKTAKEFFKEAYGTPLNASYSLLIKDFEKNKRNDEVAFCEAMFATYYSSQDLTNDRAVALGSLLIDLDRKKKRREEISRIPSTTEKIGRFLSLAVKNINKKRKVRAEAQQIKKLEKKRIAERNRKLKIVKKREALLRKQKIKEDIRLKKIQVDKVRQAQKLEIQKRIELEKRRKKLKIAEERRAREKHMQEVAQKKILLKKHKEAAKRAKKRARLEAKLEKKRKKLLVLQAQKRKKEEDSRKAEMLARQRAIRLENEKRARIAEEQKKTFIKKTS